jgi:hypothetical protein
LITGASFFGVTGGSLGASSSLTAPDPLDATGGGDPISSSFDLFPLQAASAAATTAAHWIKRMLVLYSPLNARNHARIPHIIRL